jgi:lysine-arginine-ornithine-binding protein
MGANSRVARRRNPPSTLKMRWPAGVETQMTLWKLVRHGLIVICCAVALVGTNVAAQDKVTVATEAGYPPFSKTEADGSYSGFEIDFGNAICARANLDCEWVKQDFPGMIPGLTAQKFDFILSSMSINEERMKVALFSIPYLSDKFRFYGPKGTGVSIPDGLQGKRVGVFTGSTGEQFIQAKWGDIVDTRGYENIDQVNADLEAGRIDFGFNSILTVSEFLKSEAGANYEWFGPSYSDPVLGLGVGVMFRKEDEEMRDRINDAIRAVYADGTFDEMAKRYFSEDVSIRADELW